MPGGRWQIVSAKVQKVAVRQNPPQKARAFRVKPDMSPEQAMRGIVRTAHQHMRATEAGVLESGNPEYMPRCRLQ